MDDTRAWVLEQIKERLRYYSTFTSVGLNIPERAAGAMVEAAAEPVQEVSGETLVKVREDLGDCERCRLHKDRRNIVFGVGNPNADLMFVGEGPGYDEDVQGIPFVGKAGQLLTKIIQAIDMTRDEVYIANIVKCRPPENRDPEPDEIESCLPFLERQIRSIRPLVICTLGRVAAQALLATEKSLTKIRDRTYDYEGAVLVPTFHPAYLLRNPEKKRECWDDMKLVRRLLHERR